MATTRSAAPVLGLRERKKQESRRAIRRAALELVVEKGLEAVTIEEIAARAEVSPRTFFNYFATKESALVDPDPHRAAHLADRVRERPSGESAFEALAAVLVEETLDDAADTELWRLLREVFARHDQLLFRVLGAGAATERMLVQAVAERLGLEPEASAYPRQLVAAMTGVLRATFVHHLRSLDHGEPGTVSPVLRGALEQAVDGLRRGLPAPGPAVPRRG